MRINRRQILFNLIVLNIVLVCYCIGAEHQQAYVYDGFLHAPTMSEPFSLFDSADSPADSCMSDR